MTACTIVAANYLAHARVLAESYARASGGERLHVLLVDRPTFRVEGEQFEVLHPHDLPLEPHEFLTMAAMYDEVELATSLKPWLLRALLDRGAEVAVYLDPDVEVHAPLGDAERLARRHSVVLTPHVLGSVPLDGLKPTPRDIAIAGRYNLGFVAVASTARPFLDWWAWRLRRDCLVAVDEGLFVDQRPLDDVPSSLRGHVLRDPGWNVAYWNLHERRLTGDGAGYRVDARPLRFFHFSGFDPTEPSRLSRHGGDRPRVRTEDDPAVRRLCDDYARRLRAAGWDDARREPYGFAATPCGTVLDIATRRAYRAALVEAEGRGTDGPPHPLRGSSCRAFEEWLRSPEGRAHVPRRPSRRVRRLLFRFSSASGGGERASVVAALRQHDEVLPPERRAR